MSADARPEPGPAPLVVIDAARPAFPLDPGEVWRYRELLAFLAWRDVAVRYKQAVLGIAWAVIQPFTQMVVFTIFLGRLAGVPSDGMPYAVFAYLGLLPWTCFASAVTRAGGSLVANAALITRVYVPRVVVVLAATLSAVMDLLVASLVLGALLAWYGIVPSPAALLLLPLLGLVLLTATGLGMGLAALNVRYRDVQHAVPFLLQLWLFATPVVYPLRLVPESWRPLMALNPMAGVVEAWRAAVVGLPIPWPRLLISTASALVLAALGAWLFRRAERSFADLV
jgi:lipopolysaccharide transport system permease protein